MENNNDLNRMINELIKGIFSDALGVSLKDPAMAAFFIKATLAQKRAAKVRQRNEEQGLHVPPVMILSVTNRCNLRCAGCYSRLVPRERKPELDEAGLRSVLRQASELGISIVLLVGGEPLTRPELFNVTVDLYIVADKTKEEWDADGLLVDMSASLVDTPARYKRSLLGVKGKKRGPGEPPEPPTDLHARSLRLPRCPVTRGS